MYMNETSVSCSYYQINNLESVPIFFRGTQIVFFFFFVLTCLREKKNARAARHLPAFLKTAVSKVQMQEPSRTRSEADESAQVPL